MAARSEANREETAAATDPETDTPALALYETHPGRSVLTEEGNTEGWIASDLTIDVPR